MRFQTYLSEIFWLLVRGWWCSGILSGLLHRRSGVQIQWRNDAPGAPATPGGAVIGGRQIIIKIWNNFARLTALLAKVRVWFNNLTINLNFSAIFSQIAPSKPLNQGRHWGATFCRRGAPFRRGLQRYATVQIPDPPTLEKCAKGICLCNLLRSTQPNDRETVIEG